MPIKHGGRSAREIFVLDQYRLAAIIYAVHGKHVLGEINFYGDNVHDFPFRDAGEMIDISSWHLLPFAEISLPPRDREVPFIRWAAQTSALFFFGAIMIVEYVRYKLNEQPAKSDGSIVSPFEAAYRVAASSLDASPHCFGYELSRCVEEPNRYILRIEWDSVDGHLAGFRRSPEFAPFLAAIKPYIDQIEEMQHYAMSSVIASKHK